MQDYLVDADAAILAVLDRPRAGRDRAGRPRAHASLGAAVPRAGQQAVAGRRPSSPRRRARMTVALETIRPGKALRRPRRDQRRVAQDRAGRAPRADRPERRRQDHAHQSAHRRAAAERAAASCSKARTSRRCRSHQRVQRGLARTFQINQLFADLTPLETIGLAVSERLGHGGDWWRAVGTRRATSTTRSREHPRALPPADVMNERTAIAALRQAAPARDRGRDRRQAARAAARRAGRRRAGGRAPRHSGRRRGAAARRHRAADRARHGSRVLVRRPHLGAGQRRAVRRRHARGGRARSAREGGLSRRGAAMPDLLAIEDLRAGYGEAVVLSDMSLRARRRAGAGAARPQRHGQDHADQLDRRRHPPLRRHASRSTARDITRAARPTSARAPASAGCRRSATSSSR